MKRIMLPAASLVLFGAGCGVHREESLPATGRIQVAAVTTYGWTSLDLAQDIEVTLRPQVALADVLDMSVFGPFTPGSTHEEGLRVGGTPIRTRTDSWGEVWHIYDLPKSTVEIGCSYYTSGGTPSSCTWSLHSLPKSDPATLLLEPQFRAYLQRGIAAAPTVSIRSIEVTTADRMQYAQVFFKSRIGPGAYWSDRSRIATRRGPPRVAAQR
jgi:hypothetical protein